MSTTRFLFSLRYPKPNVQILSKLNKIQWVLLMLFWIQMTPLYQQNVQPPLQVRMRCFQVLEFLIQSVLLFGKCFPLCCNNLEKTSLPLTLYIKTPWLQESLPHLNCICLPVVLLDNVGKLKQEQWYHFWQFWHSIILPPSALTNTVLFVFCFETNWCIWYLFLF